MSILNCMMILKICMQTASINGIKRKETINELSVLGIKKKLVYEIGFNDIELFRLLMMLKATAARTRRADAA